MTFVGKGRRPQLRIAVNSRCGRACFYCRPSGEAVATPAHVSIHPDDLVFFVDTAAGLGMRDVKLTGGDPALYEPLVQVVGDIKKATGVEAIEIISRHPHIGDIAMDLKKAGADRFNVSLDTLDPALYQRICGVSDLPQLLGAVVKLVETGLPVKINMVVMEGLNNSEVEALIGYCESTGIHSLKLLDVIEDLDSGAEFNLRRLHRQAKVESLRELYSPLDVIANSLRRKASRVSIEQQGDLGHPMSVLEMPSGLRVIVKDSQAGAWYGDMCKGCRFYPCHDALMALRLTADLRAQFCLLREDVALDLGAAIKSRNEKELRSALALACQQYDTAQFIKAMSSAAMQPEARVMG